MSRTVKVIIVVVSAAVLLTAILFGVQALRDYMEHVRNPETTGEQETTVALISIDPNTVDELIIENSFGRYDLVNGHDGWELASGETALDQDSAAVYAMMASSVYAASTVQTGVSDFSIYGLSNPVRVSVKSAAGQQTLLVGGLTPTEEAFYISMEGSDTVYTLGPNIYTKDALQIGKLFATNIMSIIMSKDYIPDEDFNYLLFQREGEVVIETDRREDLQWHMTRPIDVDTEGTGLSVVLLALRDAESVSYVGRDLPEDKLEEYGLTEPKYVISYRCDSGKARTVRLGKDSSPTCVYAQDQDTGTVVTLSRDKLDFLDKKTVELVSCVVYLHSINEHASIAVTAGSRTDQLKITYDKTSGKAVSNDLNGQEITAGQASEFYSKVLTALLPLDIDAKAAPREEAAVKLRLERTDGAVEEYGFVPRVNAGDGRVYDYYLTRGGEYTGIIVDGRSVGSLSE